MNAQSDEPTPTFCRWCGMTIFRHEVLNWWLHRSTRLRGCRDRQNNRRRAEPAQPRTTNR